jgi:hypothetical protein
MAEQVQTGGTMTFDYSGSRLRPDMDPMKKKAIEDAYLLAEQRKEKIKKIEWMVGIIIGALVIFGGLIYYYFS